jgi:hypothetical protein
MPKFQTSGKNILLLLGILTAATKTIPQNYSKTALELRAIILTIYFCQSIFNIKLNKLWRSSNCRNYTSTIVCFRNDKRWDSGH